LDSASRARKFSRFLRWMNDCITPPDWPPRPRSHCARHRGLSSRRVCVHRSIVRYRTLRLTPHRTGRMERRRRVKGKKPSRQDVQYWTDRTSNTGES
jgi:hypothetical protein